MQLPSAADGYLIVNYYTTLHFFDLLFFSKRTIFALIIH